MKTPFEVRLARHLDELRWLYMELYGNDAMFAELLDHLRCFSQERSAALQRCDLEREANPEWYKSCTLTGMMLYIDNFAGDLTGVRKKLPYLQQTGVNLIHLMPFLDTVPYIWKELGTDCRNRPQVHTIVRMMRMIGEIVCPSVILLGEVVMEPVKVVPYFGTVEKPECHLLYNVTTMCTTWHTVATQDTRLLRRQLDLVNALPKEYVFLNYLRCHDDIGWGLDYGWLHQNFGIDEVAHKKFLSQWFQGHWAGSVSRGELYNDDPASGDARQCGTTASLCGIEKAGFENDPAAMERAVRFNLTLHAMMFMQTGLPLLYSGDELAQVNDYSYKDDPKKAEDSRYIHRGRLRWDLAEHIHNLDTPEGQVFCGLNALNTVRKANPAFGVGADVWTLDTGDDGLLAIGRYFEGQKIIGVFNFTPLDKLVTFPHDPGKFTNMMTGSLHILQDLTVPAYGFYYLEQTQNCNIKGNISIKP